MAPRFLSNKLPTAQGSSPSHDIAAIVTGAASGIGLATTKHLVSLGYFVVMVDRDAEGLKKAENEINLLSNGHNASSSSSSSSSKNNVNDNVKRVNSERVKTITVDVSKPEDIDRMAKECKILSEEQFWLRHHTLTFKYLVHSAGCDFIEDLEKKENDFCTPGFSDDIGRLFDRAVEVNLRSVYLITRAVLPLLKAGAEATGASCSAITNSISSDQGAGAIESSNLQTESDEGAAIVAVASIQAHRSHPDFTAYAATKGGIISICRQMAGDLAKYNIRVNTVSPGAIATNLGTNSIKYEGEFGGGSEVGGGEVGGGEVDAGEVGGGEVVGGEAGGGEVVGGEAGGEEVVGGEAGGEEVGDKEVIKNEDCDTSVTDNLTLVKKGELCEKNDFGDITDSSDKHVKPGVTTVNEHTSTAPSESRSLTNDGDNSDKTKHTTTLKNTDIKTSNLKSTDLKKSNIANHKTSVATYLATGLNVSIHTTQLLAAFLRHTLSKMIWLLLSTMNFPLARISGYLTDVASRYETPPYEPPAWALLSAKISGGNTSNPSSEGESSNHSEIAAESKIETKESKKSFLLSSTIEKKKKSLIKKQDNPNNNPLMSTLPPEMVGEAIVSMLTLRGVTGQDIIVDGGCSVLGIEHWRPWREEETWKQLQF